MRLALSQRRIGRLCIRDVAHHGSVARKLAFVVAQGKDRTVDVDFPAGATVDELHLADPASAFANRRQDLAEERLFPLGSDVFTQLDIVERPRLPPVPPCGGRRD